MIQQYDEESWNKHVLELDGQSPCRFERGARLVTAPEIGPTVDELGWLRETLLSLPVRAVLDFGCGIGLFAGLFDGLEYTGLDRTPSMIDAARKNHPEKLFLLGGIESTHEESFDLVFTRAVIQHNLEPVKSQIIQGIHAILRPAGYYLFHEHQFILPGEARNETEEYMERFGFTLLDYYPTSCYLFQKGS